MAGRWGRHSNSRRSSSRVRPLGFFPAYSRAAGSTKHSDRMTSGAAAVTAVASAFFNRYIPPIGRLSRHPQKCAPKFKASSMRSSSRSNC
jgi:hypothetical protein